MPGVIVRAKVEHGVLDSLIQSTPRADTMIAERCARAIVTAAKARVPVDTGALKASINAYGTGGTWFAEAAMFYASFVEFGTSKMGARPYMIPARESVNYNQIAIQVLRELGW